MTEIAKILFAALASYIAGSIPFSYIITRLVKKTDITTLGSGNPGATNVYRSYGYKLGLPVLILDIAKGYIPAYIASMSDIHYVLVPVVVLAVILGHDFSPFLKFKGGKGVATSVGIFLFLAPGSTILVIIIFTAITVIFKFVSFGSIMAALSFPFITYFKGNRDYFWLSAIVAGLIIFQHRNNLKRLWYGREKRSV
ncbi:MAG: glycerol-3-phosphate 1-O-acyltransferase PlsY [Elusimicrobiota bacterium]